MKSLSTHITESFVNESESTYGSLETEIQKILKKYSSDINSVQLNISDKKNDASLSEAKISLSLNLTTNNEKLPVEKITSELKSLVDNSGYKNLSLLFMPIRENPGHQYPGSRNPKLFDNDSLYEASWIICRKNTSNEKFWLEKLKTHHRV